MRRFLLSSIAYFAPPGEAGSDPDPVDDAIDPSADDPAPQPGDDPEPDDAVDPADDDAVDPAADDDADANADPGADPAPARAAGPQSRAERRIAALQERSRQQAEEIARLTRAQFERSQQPAETPQQRAERLALLTPEERMQVTLDERLAEHSRNQQQITNQLLDASDRASFQAVCTSNPVAKKLEAEVERRLQVLRSQGNNLPRQVVLTYIVGERALAQTGKQNPGRDQRRRQQVARPANGGGDVQPARQRRGGNDLENFERTHGDTPI